MENIEHNQSEKKIENLLKFLEDFSKKYQEEKVNLPYHINVIDELNAHENDHSRILAKLLRYKPNKEKDEYPFLQSFLNDLCKFDKIKNIKDAKVGKVDSCGRIDIPIFINQYVVVIENKVTGAQDQNKEKGGQLARYIETIRTKYRREPEQIFVVYTTKYKDEPSDDCWKNQDNYSYKDDFKDRFRSVSYWEIIYPWLKEILKKIDSKDTYLLSAVEQYVDYLEGEKMFKNRDINKKMDMELRNLIKDKLELDKKDLEDALETVSDKVQEMKNALDQLNGLKKTMLEKQFCKWTDKLKEKYPKYSIVGDCFANNANNTGIKLKYKNIDITLLLEFWSERIIYGISTKYLENRQKQDMDFSGIPTVQIQFNNPDWYALEDTTFKEAYGCLENLIKEIEEHAETNG